MRSYHDRSCGRDSFTATSCNCGFIAELISRVPTSTEGYVPTYVPDLTHESGWQQKQKALVAELEAYKERLMSLRNKSNG